jgi:hypothetical protein
VLRNSQQTLHDDEFILKESLVIMNVLLLIELKVVSHLLMERKIKCRSLMTLKLTVTAGVGISIVTLFAVLIVSSISKEQAAFALTRGTPYDDLLSSSMTENSNRNEMSFMETNGTRPTPSANSSSVFIYGDLGNDEIRGSNQSDHLGGGPGSDVIYGYNGGDYIQGDLGIDSLYGEEGDDVLSGGEGADYFDCGEGRDSVDDFDPVKGDFAVGNCEVLENEEKPAVMQ